MGSCNSLQMHNICAEAIDAERDFVHTRTQMDDQGLGFSFYAKLAGLAVAIGFAVLIVVLILWRAVYAWGFLGMFIFLALVLLGFGWVTDRRQAQQRYEPE